MGALELLPVSRKVKEKILKRSLGFLRKEFPSRKIPSYYITEVHRILKEESGIAYPFKALREKCNIVGMALAARVGKKALRLNGVKRFEYLIRWTIAGNHFDFRTIGAGYRLNTEKVGKKLTEIVRERLKVDNIQEIFQAVKRSHHILYIHDNVGEIALDTLLIQELSQWCPVVVSALRGGPITSDATVEDGRQVGLDSAVSRIISAGPDTLGISWEEMSPELRKEINAADLIVAKGQANFYVLSGHRKEIRAPVVFLLRTKCTPVAEFFGFQGQGNVAALDRGSKKSYFSGEIGRQKPLKTSGSRLYTAPQGDNGRVQRLSRGPFREFEQL